MKRNYNKKQCAESNLKNPICQCGVFGWRLLHFRIAFMSNVKRNGNRNKISSTNCFFMCRFYINCNVVCVYVELQTPARYSIPYRDECNNQALEHLFEKAFNSLWNYFCYSKCAKLWDAYFVMHGLVVRALLQYYLRGWKTYYPGSYLFTGSYHLFTICRFVECQCRLLLVVMRIEI